MFIYGSSHLSSFIFKRQYLSSDISKMVRTAVFFFFLARKQGKEYDKLNVILNIVRDLGITYVIKTGPS